MGDVLQVTKKNAEHAIFAEARYGPKKRRADTCDWIMATQTAGAFIECKSKRMSLAARMGEPTAFDDELGKLGQGIAQLYRSLNDYRAGKYPQLQYDAGRRVYPVIVDSEEWYLVGDPILKRLDSAVRAHLKEMEVPEAFVDDAPFSLLSVAEFEAAAQIIEKVGIAQFFDTKHQHAEMRVWSFHEYMRDTFKAEWSARERLLSWGTPDLFENLILDESAQEGGTDERD